MNHNLPAAAHLTEIRAAIRRAAAQGVHVVITHQHDAGEYVLPGQIDVVEADEPERIPA